MTDPSSHDIAPDADRAESAPRWLINFRRSDHRRGSYISGDGFGVVFTDRGDDVLMVSFDNVSSAAEDTLDRLPWGYDFVAKNGWSQLGVMTFGADWYRNTGILEHLENLREQGFFRRFGKVVMTGTSMGGYAACAFASLAPGCTVIAFSPQSTLKPELVPWETRFPAGRRADWSGAFVDGAAESAAAGQVFLVYDPGFQPDQRHIDRFTTPNVIHLKARYAGHKSALFLRRAGLLSTVVRQTVAGRMSPGEFARIYRAARTVPWFLYAMKARIGEGGHAHLLPRFAKAVSTLGHEKIARSARAMAKDRSGPPLENARLRPTSHEMILAASARMTVNSEELPWQNVQKHRQKNLMNWK
ncbi:hypothetical protein Q0601_03340 [Paracoccus onubensis]|uniref:hypothetical protein n=1 Tax=Paracoccus onubensis TaxID=1675788 RepID=UPI00272FF037|nr:hypothetical protein [Paracoccus onubensis]MDP0926198.1 hypothetical protein [Paracoccus onubensis]